MTDRDAAATLRTVSALRALCLRLPHLPTPAEAERLRRFAWLVKHPQTAAVDDCDALAAGCRQWWRERRWRDIATLARALPPSIVAGDRRLATYSVAADQACER